MACPAKGGETIAGQRCIEYQEQSGCYCERALGVLEAMKVCAESHEVWVRKQPAWKQALLLRVSVLLERHELLSRRGVVRQPPRP